MVQEKLLRTGEAVFFVGVLAAGLYFAGVSLKGNKVSSFGVSQASAATCTTTVTATFTTNDNVEGAVTTTDNHFYAAGTPFTVYDASGPKVDTVSVKTLFNPPDLVVKRQSGYFEIFAHNRTSGYGDQLKTARLTGTLTISNGTFTSALSGVDEDGTDTGLETTTDGDYVTIISPTTIQFNLYFSEPGDGARIYYTPSTSCQTTTTVCSTNADCGSPHLSGGPTCQGNSVYQDMVTPTCANPGTTASYCHDVVTSQLQQTCLANQTCSAGQCGGNNTICTYHAYQQCVGNSVYWFSSCGQQQDLSQTCLYNQTCAGSQCVGGGNMCTYHAYQQCVGNSVYWYDSCGHQQDVSQVCSYNQTCQNNTCSGGGGQCTYHAYQQCVGNSVYWFSSCGQQQDLSQTCLYNQTCSGSTCSGQGSAFLNITMTGRNLSSGNLTWSNTVNAAPNDVLQFQVVVQNSGSSYLNNFTLTDTLPNNLYYDNNLVVDGLPNSGNITSGLLISSLQPGMSTTITFQARVAPGQNFSFGSTTLTTTVNAMNSGQGSLGSSSATVIVTKSSTAGATYVSTGLTNNFWVDSFFLPLVLALLALWLWKTGLIDAAWFQAKRNKYRDYVAGRRLMQKVNQIRRQGPRT